MDVSPPEPPLVAMDLSKTYNTRTRSGSTTKKPEWYHRRPAGCGAELSSPSPASSYRTRASSSSFASQSAAAVMEPGPEPLAGFMNSTLAPHLDLYRDGVHANLWHPGFYRDERGGSPAPESSGGEESDSGSDVIFLVSSTKEPLLCGSFIQDGVGHMVAPLSPAASSPDDGRSCYHLPQPLSSNSPDSSFSEDSSDSSVDIPVHHARPVVLVSDLCAVYGAAAAADASSDDDSDVVEVAVTESKKKPSGENPEDGGEAAEVRRSSRIRKSSSDTPPRSCSGTRHSLRRRAKSNAVGIYNESGDSDDLMEFVVRASSSDESLPPPRLPPMASSLSEDEPPPEPPRTRSRAPCRKSVPRTASSVPEAKKPRKSEPKPDCRVPQTQPKSSPPKNKPSARRRARRRRQPAASGPFPPREPEIQLRFAKRKEERKKKAEDFCPFVRVEQRTCVVVNYQDEEARGGGGGGGGGGAGGAGGRPPAGSLSGFIPNTSCFQLCRPGPDSRSPASLLCCLCGYSANAMGLGDLHGPYALARSCTDASSGEKTPESHRRSDSFLGNSDEDGNVPPDGARRPPDSTRNLPNRPGTPPDGAAGPPDGAGSSPDGAGTPDSPVPPPSKAPLPLDECWIHEDCGIWSAGVFLVRGRLYGLEEAARLAQEAMCSSCQRSGAILGCFQKSCGRSYHYRCAVQSGCVLNEENFSMRCPEHKNKPSTKQQHR